MDADFHGFRIDAASAAPGERVALLKTRVCSACTGSPTPLLVCTPTTALLQQKHDPPFLIAIPDPPFRISLCEVPFLYTLVALAAPTSSAMHSNSTHLCLFCCRRACCGRGRKEVRVPSACRARPHAALVCFTSSPVVRLQTVLGAGTAAGHCHRGTLSCGRHCLGSRLAVVSA